MWILFTDSNASAPEQHADSDFGWLFERTDEPTLPTNISDPTFWLLDLICKLCNALDDKESPFVLVKTFVSLYVM